MHSLEEVTQLKSIHRVGAHLSTQSGIKGVVEQAASINANACQIFTAPPRRWNIGVMPKKVDIETDTAILEIVSHANYLSNIGSLDSDIQEKTLMSLTSEITRCNLLGIKYLVIHGGSSKGGDRGEALHKAVYALKTLSDIFDGMHPYFLIENAVPSSGGGKLATSIKDFKFILEGLSGVKVGVCIDLGHLFVSGIDVRSEKTFYEYFASLDHILGGRQIHLVHVSDNHGGLGSLKDKHASFGEGKIGLNHIKHLMNCTLLKDSLKILETPKPSLYKQEIDTMVSLLQI